MHYVTNTPQNTVATALAAHGADGLGDQAKLAILALVMQQLLGSLDQHTKQLKKTTDSLVKPESSNNLNDLISKQIQAASKSSGPSPTKGNSQQPNASPSTKDYWQTLKKYQNGLTFETTLQDKTVGANQADLIVAVTHITGMYNGQVIDLTITQEYNIFSRDDVNSSTVGGKKTTTEDRTAYGYSYCSIKGTIDGHPIIEQKKCSTQTYKSHDVRVEEGGKSSDTCTVNADPHDGNTVTASGGTLGELKTADGSSSLNLNNFIAFYVPDGKDIQDMSPLAIQNFFKNNYQTPQ